MWFRVDCEFISTGLWSSQGSFSKKVRLAQILKEGWDLDGGGSHTDDFRYAREGIHSGLSVGRHSFVERTKKIKLIQKNVAGFLESPA